MPLISKEYQEWVLDDLASYKGLTHPEKAGFFERLLRRSRPTLNLHPNPDDEFSKPDIGPSYAVIERYVRDWSRLTEKGLKPDIEKLSVEKMSAGGYMLLDGHHRWYAARRLGIQTMPVSIINVTPVEDIILSIQRSKGRLCASLDLDEVILTDAAADDGKARRFFKRTMRKKAPQFMRELKSMGFDVWVYTGNYVNDSSLHKMFSLHRVKIDGIVSGLRSGTSRERLRDAFAEKYEYTIHVDLKGITCVNTRTKQFETADITGEWASGAMQAVKQLMSAMNV